MDDESSVYTSPHYLETVTKLNNPSIRYRVPELQHEWYSVVMARLTELTQLPIGWDGYRAGPVSFENANFAIRMLETICRADACAPQIVPGYNGDLQVEWHAGDCEIEMHVLAPYNVHTWHRSRETAPDGEEVEFTTDFTEAANWMRELERVLGANATAAA